MRNKNANHISIKLNSQNVEPICNKNEYDKLMKLQNPDIKKYVDANIDVYIFPISNHPLEKKLKKEKPTSVLISVFISDNKIIGGISVPLYNGEMKMGEEFYSLDGNTLEESIDN